jgi:glycosyltransferase involved in cell wall biosynthesis
LAGIDNLRVTFIVGGLSNGGAEKQFLYMLSALGELGVKVQVITLTQGEHHEDALARQGIQPIYAGAHPAARIANILKAVRSFKPHFIQASHFFASFYAGIAGRLSATPSIGAVRSDLYLDLEGVGRMGPWLLHLPSVFLANSWKARENAAHLGLSQERVHVLHNVIDLDAFDQRAVPDQESRKSGQVTVVTVARLVPVKRMERFLTALALARQETPELVGWIIGDGPSMVELHAVAKSLGLRPDEPSGGVRFLGERSDIPHLLTKSDLFVLTSDREGFPNVLLEAMAASLPILTTPAGETRELVTEGLNGYFLPFDDSQLFARRLIELARSPRLRQQMGYEGRQKVERQFSYPRLKNSLLDTYLAIAEQTRNKRALAILEICQRWNTGESLSFQKAETVSKPWTEDKEIF